MKTKRMKKQSRDLEAERKTLLDEMGRHISKDTREKIDVAVKAMEQTEKYRITVSHEGTGNADHK